MKHLSTKNIVLLAQCTAVLLLFFITATAKTLTLRESLLKEKIQSKNRYSRGPVFADSFYEELKKVTSYKQFVFIVPSRNNEKWCERNMLSMLTQRYQNFRIIYIDDASTDKTYEMVTELVKKHHFEKRCTIIKQQQSMKMAYNRYMAAHKCDNEEILVFVDGDDWLLHDEVLTFLNMIYQDPDVWVTYGQMVYYPSGELGLCKEIPFEYSEKQLLRQKMTDLPFPHLRTCYAWLFKMLPADDFMTQGTWMEAATDRPLMYGLLELAGQRHRSLQNVLYVYNRAIDENTHKINMKMLVENKMEVLQRPPYKALPHKPRNALEYTRFEKAILDQRSM